MHNSKKIVVNQEVIMIDNTFWEKTGKVYSYTGKILRITPSGQCVVDIDHFNWVCKFSKSGELIDNNGRTGFVVSNKEDVELLKTEVVQRRKNRKVKAEIKQVVLKFQKTVAEILKAA